MDVVTPNTATTGQRTNSQSCSLNSHYLEPRIYQQMLFAEAREKNSLVVLPTGMGKTVIMAYLVADCFSTIFHEGSRGLILIVAPSKPLVDQIRKILLKYITVDPHRIVSLTGQIPPNKRQALYHTTSCIVATPQTIANDVAKKRCPLKQIKLILVDEAHRARGDYAYAKIVDQLDQTTRIVGFTATPGKDEPSIQAVVKSLRIQQVIFRSADDPDIAPYAGKHIPKAYFLSLGQTYFSVDALLCGFRDSLAKSIKSLGYPLEHVNRRTIQALAERLEDVKSRQAGAARTFAANLSRVLYLRSLLFSSGLEILFQTLQEWRERPKARLAGPNALKYLLKDPTIRAIEKIAREHRYPHPKYYKLLDILQEVSKASPDSKIIIFAHFRATVKFLIRKLRKEGIKCLQLLGQNQGHERGMNQKTQQRVISTFKLDKNINVLIATQVAEEGIDVGACDLVIFYDVVSSPLRDIQRTGRGRRKESRVIYLVSKQTVEERAYWALKEDVRRMEKTINAIQQQLNFSSLKRPEKPLIPSATRETPISSPTAVPSKQLPTLRQIYIFVDSLLYSKEIMRYLQENKINVDVFRPPKDIKHVIQLPHGSHIILLSVARLWELLTHSQWAEFTRDLHYLESPLIIIEGDLAKDVNPIILLQIQQDLQTHSGVTTVHSPSAAITKRFVLDLILNDRPQKIQGSNIALQALCLIPDIGQKKAQALLEEFSTLKKLGMANPSQIQQVSGIGSVLSKRIHQTFNQTS
ncbi:MAG: helicase-related protein [Candidatus Heimdallarchaeota archaeon]